MIANFYLMAESFAHNEMLSSDTIEKKIKSLSEDVILIHKYKDTNILYANYTDLYPQIFYETFTVQEFLCNPQILKQHGIDRDIIVSLQKILDRSTDTLITSEEVISELLSWNDDENCHGIIAFHKIEGLDENHQILYGIDGWLKFRRYYLSQYPKNEKFFITECEKYFPDLIFHDNTITTISRIFSDFHKKIIYHLTALNDRFRESQDGFRNRQQVLEHFSGNCNLDTIASLEGDASRKPFFTYDFVNKQGIQQSVCCEPHLKLCYSGISGDNTYYQHRIYFHEGHENISNNKILIGHIGEHLKFN